MVQVPRAAPDLQNRKRGAGDSCLCFNKPPGALGCPLKREGAAPDQAPQGPVIPNLGWERQQG